MADHESKEQPLAYTPPDVAWTMDQFLAASRAEIDAKTVTCDTCPVFISCEAGSGGSGWTCVRCSSTGVLVDVPEVQRMPDNLLIIDCAKHKFERKQQTEQLLKCALCSGQQMQLEGKRTKNHYVRTAYAMVTVEERKKVLTEARTNWQKMMAADAVREALAVEAHAAETNVYAKEDE